MLVFLKFGKTVVLHSSD